MGSRSAVLIVIDVIFKLILYHGTIECQNSQDVLLLLPKGPVMTNQNLENSESKKIFLKDYKSPAYEIEHVNLDFCLNEDSTLVTTTMSLQQLRDEPLELNGEELKLISIKLNGEALKPEDYVLNETHLILNKSLPKMHLEIITELKPELNTSLEGLYKSGGIFCTQCEAQGFRKITYFLDRPDVMTKYTVTIEADEKKYPVLLSNGDRLRIEKIGNGRHKAFWQDPHKKPCYLFALVAGDLGVIKDHFTTHSGRKVNLEVYAPHGKQERCHHAMESLKKSMKWDEDTFGLEYDLNDYMIVSIDDFNAGAMENKGLNIFNSRLVLADSKSATDADFNAIESVVAHEYFHNWTGNRVTLNSWFQLSLKEGLTVFRDQEFSSDLSHRGVQRVSDVDGLRQAQFAEDAGPNSHPVRPDSCLAVDNFFTSTIYEKGSEVIRMMQALVGRKGFRKGMDEYFRRHDGQAVSTDDFAASIAEPNQKDFTQFKNWYTQAGTPKVIVQENYDAATETYTLNFEQKLAKPEYKAFHIPLIFELYSTDGTLLNFECDQVTYNSDNDKLIELTMMKQSVTFKKIKAKPVLSLLRQFSAPIILDWNQSESDLYFLMAHDTDLYCQREAAQTLASRELKKIVSAIQSKQTLTVDDNYTTAIKKILSKPDQYSGVIHFMLLLPSLERMTQEFETLDITAFQQAREYFYTEITQAIQNELMDIYKKFHGIDTEKIDAKTTANRSLKNFALQLLAQYGTKKEHAVCMVEEQYKSTTSMTDKIAALSILVEISKEKAQPYLDLFFEEWKNDSLVINKWFSLQAMVRSYPNLEKVRELCFHPSFNIKNPNNVYALLRNFGGNLVQFYKGDQEVLRFYLEKIKEIDKMNPQVAARLCSAFNYVEKTNPTMRQFFKTEIANLLKSTDLSNNTKELLIKT